MVGGCEEPIYPGGRGAPRLLARNTIFGKTGDIWENKSFSRGVIYKQEQIPRREATPECASVLGWF